MSSKHADNTRNREAAQSVVLTVRGVPGAAANEYGYGYYWWYYAYPSEYATRPDNNR